jgi:hypothetical protein
MTPCCDWCLRGAPCCEVCIMIIPYGLAETFEMPGRSDHSQHTADRRQLLHASYVKKISADCHPVLGRGQLIKHMGRAGLEPSQSPGTCFLLFVLPHCGLTVLSIDPSLVSLQYSSSTPLSPSVTMAVTKSNAKSATYSTTRRSQTTGVCCRIRRVRVLQGCRDNTISSRVGAF